MRILADDGRAHDLAEVAERVTSLRLAERVTSLRILMDNAKRRHGWNGALPTGSSALTPARILRAGF